MTDANENKCPVCSTGLQKVPVQREAAYFECPRCGPFAMGDRALYRLRNQYPDNPKAHAKLSHSIYKMSRSPGKWSVISDELFQAILAAPVGLPSPAEQLANFIQWLGEVQSDVGAWVDFSPQTIAAVGALDENGVGFIATESARQGFIKDAPKPVRTLGSTGGYAFMPMQLTLHGWQYYQEILRGRVTNRIAFMAMPFGNDELNQVVQEQFVPAVRSTGYELKRLDQRQPAGSIDDRLRVEIRQARFLVADLTHKNSGAYWEAGYAEGLGKPVIYTCRKDIFDNEETRPHFDTNHHLTVLWRSDAPTLAVEKMKDTIRATLPDEAIQDDTDLKNN
jgi:hypothetical protein